MQNLIFIIVFIFTLKGLAYERPKPLSQDDFPSDLKDWKLFKEEDNFKLFDDLHYYELNTGLYSDYANKIRHLIVPKEEKIKWSGQKLIFPKGTILVKTFFYGQNEMEFIDGITGPWGKNKFLIETRILYRGKMNWLAGTYRWDLANKKANILKYGETLDLMLKRKGDLIKFDYIIPSSLQCVHCHNSGSKFPQPIGPSRADNLHKNSQLEDWMEIGILEKNENIKNLRPLPVWDDPQKGSVISRAHAYLEVNCAHCHNPAGIAQETGLFLENERALVDDYKRLSPIRGFCKKPTYFGHKENIIKPANPDQSEMIYRMESRDFSEVMPLLGRDIPHQEGIGLIKEYIKAFQQNCD